MVWSGLLSPWDTPSVQSLVVSWPKKLAGGYVPVIYPPSSHTLYQRHWFLVVFLGDSSPISRILGRCGPRVTCKACSRWYSKVSFWTSVVGGRLFSFVHPQKTPPDWLCWVPSHTHWLRAYHASSYLGLFYSSILFSAQNLILSLYRAVWPSLGLILSLLAFSPQAHS